MYFWTLGSFPREAAQSGNEMGIRQEAHVEDEVRVRGDAVFIAKTDDGDEHGTLVGILEALGDEGAEFVDVELGGVDHHVGKLADGLHESAFVAEAFADGQGFAERMGTARLAVTAEQCVIVGVDEHQGDGMILAKMFQQRREFFELYAFAGIDEKSGTSEIALAGGVQFGKNRHQLDGKIIDAVEAHVLEGFEDGAFSRAGDAGKDNEMARVASGWRLHGFGRLSSLPGAGACWGCAYLRGIWRRCGG